jgi:hypothetical protein
VALLCAGRAHAQTQASADSVRALTFDRLDRTSRTLLSTVWCGRNAAYLRGVGVLGPHDSVGRTGLCLLQNGRALAAYFTPDSTYTRAVNVRVVDIADSAWFRGAVDTSAMLAQARAANEAVRRGFASFQQEKRAFTPVSIRGDGDSIAVWLLPLGLFSQPVPAAAGGERAYIYSPDGRTLVREIDAFDRHRALVIPDSGLVEIVSKESDLPLVSELIAANRIHTSGREVRVITTAFISQLVRGPPEVWVQLKRQP